MAFTHHFIIPRPHDQVATKMTAARGDAWKSRELGEEEARNAREKEQTELAAASVPNEKEGAKKTTSSAERDIEGGFGGQEDLEDRYATTSGEH